MHSLPFLLTHTKHARLPPSPSEQMLRVAPTSPPAPLLYLLSGQPFATVCLRFSRQAPSLPKVIFFFPHTEGFKCINLHVNEEKNDMMLQDIIE